MWGLPSSQETQSGSTTRMKGGIRSLLESVAAGPDNMSVLVTAHGDVVDAIVMEIVHGDNQAFQTEECCSGAFAVDQPGPDNTRHFKGNDGLAYMPMPM